MSAAAPAGGAGTPTEFMDFLFGTLSDIMGAIADASAAISGALISGLIGPVEGLPLGILHLLFAFQVTKLVIDLLLDGDGFEFVADGIKLAAVYAIIWMVLTNWGSIGIPFVNYVNGLLTGAISAASGVITDGAGSVSGSNPVEVLADLQAQIQEELSGLMQTVADHREQILRDAEAIAPPVDANPAAPGSPDNPLGP